MGLASRVKECAVQITDDNLAPRQHLSPLRAADGVLRAIISGLDLQEPGNKA